MPNHLTIFAWVHDLDPYAIKLWEGGPIKWYGLSYILGFIVGYLLVRRVTKVGISTLKPQRVADFIVTLAVGVVVGGRLGYVFFYQPSLLWTFFESPPWWGVLAINHGGMASHGGITGTILAAMWFAWRHKHSKLHLMDLMAFGAPLGLFMGRIANFINGELYGRACSKDFPLAVQFPTEIRDYDAQRWQQLQASLTEHGLTYPGINTPGRYQAGVQQLLADVRRGLPDVVQALEPVLTYRHPSQLYAAVTEGLVVFAVLAIAWWKPRKPPLVGSLFCITYGLMRIVNEFFRMPDAHLLDREFAVTGITRGQWLSVLLIGLGVIGLVVHRRIDLPKMGGWRAVNAEKPVAAVEPVGRS